MSASIPYPSARNDDGVEPGAGPDPSASLSPLGRASFQPNAIVRFKTEPSLPAASLTCTEGDVLWIWSSKV